MNEAAHADHTAPPNAPAEVEAPARGGSVWWRLPVLLTVVLVAIVAARSSQAPEGNPRKTTATKATPPDASGKTVSLVVRFEDGHERKFDAIAWHAGMTVDDLMTAASRLPNGLVYYVRGDHDMVLVQSIDGVFNGSKGQNWMYSVNGVPADRSVAVYELQPGDRVLWTLEGPA